MTIQKQTKAKRQNASSTTDKPISAENKEAKSEITEERKGAITLSSLCTSNVIGSAMLINDLYGKLLDASTLADYLSEKIDKVVNNDLRGVESMLVAQAQVLDALFKNMLLKISGSNHLTQLQTYSEIALKAQTQSRQTLALLIELKNPKRTMFVKQQNNAINQQINNIDMFSNLEKTENKPAHTNELLIEAKTHETLELGKPKETSIINPQMETVGKIDRS